VRCAVGVRVTLLLPVQLWTVVFPFNEAYTQVAYLGFEKGGGADLYMPFPSPPFPSPLAHTPPSPPSPLYFLALPSQPFPTLLPSLPLLTGVRGYNPRKIF
jgi:hypothetical protein